MDKKLHEKALARVRAMTIAEARQSLVDSGIIDEDGQLTAPYRELAEKEVTFRYPNGVPKMTEQTEVEELKAEVERLKERLYHWTTFRCNETEQERAKKFCDEHKEHGQPKRMTFLPTSSITFSFTKTGVGPLVTLKCRCGAEQDITDSEDW